MAHSWPEKELSKKKYDLYFLTFPAMFQNVMVMLNEVAASKRIQADYIRQ
tara:strand:+ start:109 stop:258 length:150 start_codon:yes stop_codon:yes gene_type:complete